MRPREEVPRGEEPRRPSSFGKVKRQHNILEKSTEIRWSLDVVESSWHKNERERES